MKNNYFNYAIAILTYNHLDKKTGKKLLEDYLTICKNDVLGEKIYFILKLQDKTKTPIKKSNKSKQKKRKKGKNKTII